VLKDLPFAEDPNLLVGYHTSDDAGVYRLNDESAVVLTVDFFQPIVDDPFDFGRVAAANSLSDIFAMGGRPLAALNIAAFPEGTLPARVLREILRGGAEAVHQAGAVVAGGHTVNNKELIYGLAVFGRVHPSSIVTNRGAKPGDALILTKPLGTGILSTAIRADKLPAEDVAALVAVMTQLNRQASIAMVAHGANACTDITGYGLLGHSLEMARASDVTCEIESVNVPVLPGVHHYAGQGMLTGGGGTNRTFVQDHLSMDAGVDEITQHVLFDPQTSGGLLIAAPEPSIEGLMRDLRETYPDSAVIGQIKKKEHKALVVR
jgi:selenide,water dikinase